MPETDYSVTIALGKWRLPLLSAVLSLVVIAMLGLLLRWTFIQPVSGLNYKYLLHAHSHAALLGWLYPVLFIALIHAYLPALLRNKAIYSWQFWLSQGAVLGMLLSFPVQGYGAVSITFSTLHILLTYWFIYRFLKDSKAANVSGGNYSVSFGFMKAALFFLALSSLGPWAMGPIMATGHSGTELYYNAIYFYLHFLYNGWLTFAVFSLLFWLLERYKISFNRNYSLLFFRLMFWACLPAYLLSVLWIKPNAIVYLVGGVAALTQVVALVVLVAIVWPVRSKLLSLFGNWSRAIVLLAATAFVLKTLMQFSTAFPYMADLAYQLRNFIIGYLHLVLIGFVSFFIVAFCVQQAWLTLRSTISRWGLGLFIVGFISSEALLFLQGTFYWVGAGAIPNYNEMLFGVSIFLPVGVLLFFISQLLLGSVTAETKTPSAFKKV
ncbi:hypothetical protein JAO76_08925 [Pontibacter sp. BT310]|uniref:Cytochrome oxidase subunit I profile domain-containing protein n=1 Tax=Pontibacter populi TaxID=890055 RepID=A0ABS6XDA3_9BACT|nr:MULTISPECIES: hypothetical protein [Pontibacter]MBJ6118312.1 hypothetical protein [Pontibacter sp. BT310]MBR0570739.1 hypothetical protein [Microvirga sp. STS03]MBW3365165.1 hypothetical protein [Pontibacter populi]